MGRSIAECIQVIPLNPAQKRLHDLLASELQREAEDMLRKRSPAAWRAVRRSVTQLIQLVSNPLLLAHDVKFRHDALLGEVIAEGIAPKVVAACEGARHLARSGRKLIVWTAYNRNVESIAELLCDLSPARVHFGIAAEGKAQAANAENVVHFRSDKRCLLMVANPAALGDDIDLSASCQGAIYVDRTYNASHYLRSLDCVGGRRMHRGDDGAVRVLICPESIDESIQARLAQKIGVGGVQ